MPITTFEQAADFLAAAESHLLQDEIANGLLVGVARGVARGTPYSDAAPFFAVIRDENETLTGAAILTPPYNLLLARGTPPDALPDLIAVLRDGNWPVPGVVGPRAEAEACAADWARITDQTFRATMNMRCYELREVIPPARPADGRLRAAGPDDLDLLIRWTDAFNEEAIPDDPPRDIPAAVRRLIEAGSLFVWVDDGAVVSMAVKVRPAGQGIKITYVYTPPELRRRGYATSCVAALSRHCLDDLGYAWCTLFTDLSNPTSNDIYREVGYEPVCDFVTIRFGP